ncbi:MAG: nucleoside triphosphate pyrophosphohydrolase [Verrucomicrobiota bacterium]
MSQRPGLPVPTDEDPVERLKKIVHLLRSPGGCPWDREQTHQSLIPNVIEEAYEVAEALRRGNPTEMEDELGDLLLQVVMHAEMARDDSAAFDLESIAACVSDKLIRRHPHVFGDQVVDNTDGVLRQWDEIKRQEKGQLEAPYLKGVGEGLPALMAAGKLQKKAAKVGFDWPEVSGVIAKVNEELAEVEEVMQEGQPPERLKEELGDLLFSVVNLVRSAGHESESLLAAANAKFASRFHFIEQQLKDRGQTLAGASLDEMEALWQQSKTADL